MGSFWAEHLYLWNTPNGTTAQNSRPSIDSHTKHRESVVRHNKNQVNNNTSRFNLEAFFQHYDADVESNTRALSRNLEQCSGDLKKSILEIFVTKFMNFQRKHTQ